MINALFWVFSVVAVLGGLGMVFFRHPIYSILSLVACFFAVAGHFVLLGAPFLAAVQVIVYAGAIMVLFLFMVMLMNLKAARRFGQPGWIVAAVLALVMVFLVIVIGVGVMLFLDVPITAVESGSAAMLGRLLFTDYLIPFELASVLFLSAVVGVVMLGKKDT